MLSFHYRNRVARTGVSQGWVQDQDFVFASDKIVGADGWYTRRRRRRR